MPLYVGELIEELSHFPPDLPVLVGLPSGAMQELAMISMVRAIREGSDYVPSLGDDLGKRVEIVITLSKGER